MEVIFVTSNDHKFKEAKEILKGTEINLKRKKLEIPEIRGSINNVALDAVKKAYNMVRKPVIVEDSGFFIQSLNGFPGEFSKWVLNKIGLKGILKLMEKENNRNAYFKAVVCYKDERVTKMFSGIVKGKISKKIMGKEGFGYDPIFIPEGYKETFAQNISLKNKISHRKKALFALKNFLKKYINLKREQ